MILSHTQPSADTCQLYFRTAPSDCKPHKVQGGGGAHRACCSVLSSCLQVLGAAARGPSARPSKPTHVREAYAMGGVEFQGDRERDLKIKGPWLDNEPALGPGKYWQECRLSSAILVTLAALEQRWSFGESPGKGDG